MGIIQNDIPILEYDLDKFAVINPNHENLQLDLPEKCVFAFLGEEVDKYSRENNAKIVGYFESITKLYPIYILEFEGEKICLVQAPMGAPASSQILDWLIGYGVKKVISIGSCGTLVDIEENKFLIPVKALRAEGTSYHYIKPSRFMYADMNYIKKMEKALDILNLEYKQCVTWTTDAFYRETKDMVSYRKNEGCEVVEMEAAALMAVSQFRNIEFGQILFTADTLHNIEAYDCRNFGKDMLGLSLDICLKIIKML